MEKHLEAEKDGQQSKRTSKDKLQYVGGRIYDILSSPVGLVVLLMIYSFIGAAVFRAIEGPWEEVKNEQRVTVNQARSELNRRLQDLVRNNASNWTAVLKSHLEDYEVLLHTAWKRGIEGNGSTHVWDFWGSFLYVGTVYTTIGYGHISPSTKWGKVATMLYAVLGIPLCLIVMASIGRLLSRFFKWVWHRIRCRHKKQKRNALLPHDDVNANHHQNYETEVVLNLPVPIAIGIVFMYICIGAGLYKIWEPWSYLESFYFIFISISTIGFGDITPNHPRYFLASSLYVLFGMSLVAMTITVIMEALATTVFTAKAKLEHQVSKVIHLEEKEKDDSSIYEPVETKKQVI